MERIDCGSLFQGLIRIYEDSDRQSLSHRRNDAQLEHDNDITISGPAKSLEAIAELVGLNRAEHQFDFNSIIPYPKKFRDLDDKIENLR